MEICHGTLQPKKPQEVPWKCALVQYLAARPRYVCRCLRGGPREAQRGDSQYLEHWRTCSALFAFREGSSDKCKTWKIVQHQQN